MGCSLSSHRLFSLLTLSHHWVPRKAGSASSSLSASSAPDSISSTKTDIRSGSERSSRRARSSTRKETFLRGGKSAEESHCTRPNLYKNVRDCNFFANDFSDFLPPLPPDPPEIIEHSHMMPQQGLQTGSCERPLLGQRVSEERREAEQTSIGNYDHYWIAGRVHDVGRRRQRDAGSKLRSNSLTEEMDSSSSSSGSSGRENQAGVLMCMSSEPLGTVKS